MKQSTLQASSRPSTQKIFLSCTSRGTLPGSQDPAARPYPAPHESELHRPSIFFLRYILILSSRLHIYVIMRDT